MQKIYAHRGASGYAPENTLEAFALAAQMGAHGVELDVHLTRDGVPVVIHDETIDRTSDGTGCVAQMTLAQLRQFNYNRVMPEHPPAELPTLQDVFALLKETGLAINVELKTDDTPYDGIEETCIALAAEMNMTGRILYSSFNHDTLRRVKAIDPSLPCGLLYGASKMYTWRYAKALGMDALHPSYQQLYVPGFVHQAHRHGIAVNPWTVNEEKHLRCAFRVGADIIITNYPDRALRMLAER